VFPRVGGALGALALPNKKEYYVDHKTTTRSYTGTEMTDQPNAAYGVTGVKKYYSIGDTIARMGDPADGWYILLTGKIGVFKRDFTVAEIEKRGTVFGELGCILNRPRTATLQALEPTSVLFVQMDIDEVVAKHPEFAKRILVDLADRLTRTTESWWSVAAEPVEK
jgi:CRP-like cAMP-binding protein